MASRRYGLPDLVDALVEARRGHPDGFHALARALRVEHSLAAALVEADYGRDEHGYGHLLDDVVAALSVELSPFAGLMEAPPGVVRLYRHHGAAVARATERARSAVRAVGVDLLVFMLHVPADVRVRGEEAAELDRWFLSPDVDDW